MLRQEHVTNPGHQRAGGGAAGLFGGGDYLGEERGNLLLGRCVALEHVDSFGHQGRPLERLNFDQFAGQG